MSNKTVDERFEAWSETDPEAFYAAPELEMIRMTWRAAWAERGRVDVEAVEGERLEHDPRVCKRYRQGRDCNDCAYQSAINDTKEAIRAVDGGD